MIDNYFLAWTFISIEIYLGFFAFFSNSWLCSLLECFVGVKFQSFLQMKEIVDLHPTHFYPYLDQIKLIWTKYHFERLLAQPKNEYIFFVHFIKHQSYTPFMGLPLSCIVLMSAFKAHFLLPLEHFPTQVFAKIAFCIVSWYANNILFLFRSSWQGGKKLAHFIKVTYQLTSDQETHIVYIYAFFGVLTQLYLTF